MNIENDMERFTAAMALLFKSYSKDPDKDIVKICFLTLQHLSVEDAEQCISLAIMNEDRFPSPAALKRCQALIPPKHNTQIEHRPFGHQDNKLAEQSGRLINGYLNGKLDREKLIEGMGWMAKQYPHLNWNHEAAALVSFFRQTEPGQGSGLAVAI